MVTLLALTTVIAIGSSLMFNLPNWISLPVIYAMIFMTPAVLTIMVIYGSGYIEPFAIGALVTCTAGIAFLCLQQELAEFIIRSIAGEFQDGTRSYSRPTDRAFVSKVIAVSFWSTCLGSGMVCCAIWRLMQRGDRADAT